MVKLQKEVRSPTFFGCVRHVWLMFGTDLPVWQAHDDCGLAERYREYVRAFRTTGLEADSDAMFRGFVAGVKG